jgi:hypothetical protein
VVWARRFGGASFDTVYDVTVDALNNIYLCGPFQGTVNYGGGPLTPTGVIANYVLKLDTNGDFAWVRKIDGSVSVGAGIAVTGDSLVVAGDYFNSITVDTTTLTSVGQNDMFVLKMTASTGVTAWFRSFGGSLLDATGGVALDSRGNVVLTGTFGGTVDFGGGPLSPPSGAFQNGFLLKLADADGAHLLSKQFSSSESHGSAVVVDSVNDILITGLFQESVDFGCAGSLPASQAGHTDIFLVKYTQAGSCAWAKGFGGMATSSHRDVSAIAANSFDEIAIAGSFSGPISFGGQTLTSASAGGATDAFAARFASDGSHLSSVRGRNRE